MSPLLEAVGISKRYPNGVRAVDEVSLAVDAGRTLGIVGESGCGKSTTAKMLLRLLTPDSGRVLVDGRDVNRLDRRGIRELRRRIQVVPQDPRTSLNPRMTLGESVEFNLRVHGVARARRRQRVEELLDRVGIDPSFAQRYPHELSGGQLQRVAIARALATDPELVVCDEAVSALDKSVQAQVLNLLARLQRESGLAYVFISHDLAVVEHIADEVAVMYLGRVVERADAARLWSRPRHPYTQALLSAAPGHGRQRIVLRGDLPDPAAPPGGCGFRTRCPVVEDRCATRWPGLATVDDGHAVSCVHHPARVPVEGGAR